MVKLKYSYLIVSLFLFAIPLIAAETSCSLDATMINQDPYPAIPGEYVKFVFQVTGVENPACNDVYFELLQNYPISADSTTSTKTQIKGGTYSSTTYSSSLVVPYKVRVDENAVDGENEVSVAFSSTQFSTIVKRFNFSIENPKASFEVFVKDYDFTKKTMTFQILNTGKKDVKAITMEILPESKVQMRGSSINVVGDLDSNDYTTTDFGLVPLNGMIKVKITYTDQNNVRRSVEKDVSYNSQNFVYKTESKDGSKNIYYIVGAVIILLVIYFIWRRRKHRRHLHH